MTSTAWRSLPTASQDKTVRLWDILRGQAAAILKGHKDPVYAVAFFPDGKQFVSASDDRTIRTWEVAAGREKGQWTDSKEAIFAVAIAPHGRTVASAGSEAKVRLRD